MSDLKSPLESAERALMLVRDVMTGDPVYASPASTVRDVARLMLDGGCGEIPICEEGSVVGVITDRDIACRAVAAGRHPDSTPAREVMTRLVVTTTPDTPIEEAISLMKEEQVLRLPVLSETGQLVGMLSQSDIAATQTRVRAGELAREIARVRRKPQTQLTT